MNYLDDLLLLPQAPVDVTRNRGDSDCMKLRLRTKGAQLLVVLGTKGGVGLESDGIDANKAIGVRPAGINRISREILVREIISRCCT